MSDTGSIVIIGDLHLSDTSPSSRSDDMTETLFKKLTEIYEFCSSKSISVVIYVGDIFHKKDPKMTSHKLVNRFSSFLKGYQSKNIISLTIVGNHDLQSGNMDELYSSPLGSLIVSESLNLLNPDIGFRPFEGNLNKVLVYGHHFDYSNPKKVLDEIESRSVEGYLVDITHSYITPDKSLQIPALVTLEEIWDKKFNVMISGHIHSELGVFYNPTNPDQKFANLGSLGRGIISDDHINRIPKFLEVKFSYSEGLISSECIPHIVDCALPGESVFKIEQKVLEHNTKVKFDSFMNFMGQVLTVDKNKTIDVTLQEFFSKNPISGNLKERVLYYLDKAQQ